MLLARESVPDVLQYVHLQSWRTRAKILQRRMKWSSSQLLHLSLARSVRKEEKKKMVSLAVSSNNAAAASAATIGGAGGSGWRC